MANTDAPFGARPVRYKNGAKWNGKTTLYAISIGSTNAGQAAVGDPVVSSGAADSEGLVIVKTQAFTGGGTGAIRGFIDSIVPETPGHKVLATAAPTSKTAESLTTVGKAYVRVVDDPEVVFQIRVDSCKGTTGVAIASVGLNAGLVRTGMRTAIHKSGAQLHGASVTANISTNTLKIVGYHHDFSGANVVASPFATIEVIINNHELGHGTGSAGV